MVGQKNHCSESSPGDHRGDTQKESQRGHTLPGRGGVGLGRPCSPRLTTETRTARRAEGSLRAVAHLTSYCSVDSVPAGQLLLWPQLVLTWPRKVVTQKGQGHHLHLFMGSSPAPPPLLPDEVLSSQDLHGPGGHTPAGRGRLSAWLSPAPDRGRSGAAEPRAQVRFSQVVRVSVTQKEIHPPHRQDPREQPKTEAQPTGDMTPLTHAPQTSHREL